MSLEMSFQEPFKVERLDRPSAHQDFECFSEITRLWIAKIQNGEEMNDARDICMELQKLNIESYFSPETNKTDKLIENRFHFQDFQDYLINIQKLGGICSQLEPKIEPKIQELRGHLDKELQAMKNGGIPEKTMLAFKECMDTKIDIKIQAIRDTPKQQADKVTEEAFTHFYINTLDAYPDLHPHLGPFELEKQLRYLNTDIFHFLKQNSGINENYVEALLGCSFKLQEALSIEEFDASLKSSVKTAERMEEKIHNLPIGDSLIFQGCGVGHSILYEIIRESKDLFSFTIINTGDDEKDCLKRKPPGFSGFFVSRDRYGHKSFHVPCSILDVQFLQTIIPRNTKGTLAPDLVRQIDQSLTERGGKCTLGRLHLPQQRRSCSAKAPASWLKGELMRQLGPEKGKALYLQFKLFRAKNNYAHLLHLKNNVSQEHLKKAYSKRVYAKKTDPREKGILILETPATDEELVNHFKDLHTAVMATFAKWEKKSKSIE